MPDAAATITEHRVRRGLDLPLAGAPAQLPEDAPPVGAVAVMAADYPGMRPRMLVEPGQPVRRGEPLFEDRKSPGVLYTSPGAGRVEGVHRGERRALQSVVIALDEGGAEADAEVSYDAHPGPDPASWTADAVRALLQQSGLWTAIRERPYGKVPPVGRRPRSVVVNAMDTHPHAPDLAVALEGRGEDLAAGLRALVALASGGPVFLCVAPGSPLAAHAVDGVQVHSFAGPHPAGTAGLQIHLLDPADRDRVIWHLGAQDAAAVGHLLRTGRQDLDRVISLAGPAVRRPRLLRTRLGAAVDPLVAGELADGEVRVISGSVLDGRAAAGPVHGYLGRYHQQVAALAEDRERRFLGWLAPGLSRFSLQRLFASALLPGRRFAMTTSLGGERAMVPIGAYERVMPFEMMPTFLLRALLAGDMERAQELGCLELIEEDLALASVVCPSKIAYGPVLRALLTRIEAEG